MTSARVFVHPRCTSGPALGAMQQRLEADGVNMTNMVIFQHAHPARFELVRTVETVDRVVTYERLDGFRFLWNGVAQIPAPAPEAA